MASAFFSIVPQTQGWTPSDWASSHGVSGIEYKISSGIPLNAAEMNLLQQYSSFAPSGWVADQSVGNQSDIWSGHKESFVDVLQDRESGGGALHDLGLGGSILEDFVDAVIPNSIRNPGNNLLKDLAVVGASAAAGGYFGSGAEGAGAAGATDASTGLYAGESAMAGSGTYGTLGGGATGAGTSAAAGGTAAGTELGTNSALNGGSGMWDWLDEIDLGGPEGVGTSAPATMPPAVPAADPTFGGTLTQTGPGQYEDLGPGSMSNPALSPSDPSYWDKILQYGSRLIGGGNGGGPTGNGTADGLLGLGLGASPFLLALALAKSQGGDIDNRIRNIEGVNSQFAKANTDPYDLETSAGRSGLQTDLGLRGVAGSSFGDQAVTSFDTMRGMGRSDILSKALMSGYTTALGAKIQSNKNTNDLLGRGLLASANLFAPRRDPFNLALLTGAA